MLNVDLGLAANFTGYIDSTTGEVSCTLRATPGSTLPECPPSSMLPFAAQYKHNNMLWLTDFRDAFTKMTVNGFSTEGCNGAFPCDLASL